MKPDKIEIPIDLFNEEKKAIENYLYDVYLAKHYPADEIVVDLQDLKPGTHKVSTKYKQSPLSPCIILFYPFLNLFSSIALITTSKSFGSKLPKRKECITLVLILCICSGVFGTTLATKLPF